VATRRSRETTIVTGATGAIGPTLVQALVSGGYAVRVLARHRPEPHTLPDEVEVVVGEIGDVATLRKAVDGIDIVFHLAAKLHLPERGIDSAVRSDYERVNVDATRALAEASAQAGVRRFVYFSTIAVYGRSCPTEVFDESSPLRPESIYAETKLRGEAAVIHPSAVILRLAAVYGRRMKGNYHRLVRAIQHGTFIPIGAGANRRTLVHEEDVIRAAMLVAEQETPRRVYNVTDGDIHRVREIVEAISLAADRRLLPGYLPLAPLRLVVGAIEDALRLIGRTPPIDRQTVDKLVEDVAVSGRLLQVDLGFRPIFDLVSGWRHALGTTALQRHTPLWPAGKL
jgi:UDP-glucose 4-epimerase